MNRGKSAPRAMPNVAGVVSATAVATVAATNVPTTSNRAPRQNAANLGQTVAMSVAPIAIVVRMKSRELTFPLRKSSAPALTP